MMDCCIPTEIKLDDRLAQRYLGLLRLAAKQPDRVALSELVAAHLMRVPFENISKLHRKRQGFAGVPDARTFLDGMEQYHFGGTCYANNFHLYTLLASLGYEVKLCAADMANPDVHMVIMVSVDGSIWWMPVTAHHSSRLCLATCETITWLVLGVTATC